MDNTKEIRISGIEAESIVDGPGFRMTVFTQGCTHNCKGCHNPETHALDGGRVVTIQYIVDCMKDNPLLDGITLSGGDPMLQLEATSHLAEAVKKEGYNVWMYTGYTAEQIQAMLEKKDDSYEHLCRLLENVDVIVDGPFILEQRSLDLLFRGSKNQRILNVSYKDGDVSFEQRPEE